MQADEPEPAAAAVDGESEAEAGARRQQKAILRLSESISESLHKTFTHAAERLDRVRMEKAEQRGWADTERTLQARTAANRALAVWWANDRPPAAAQSAVAAGADAWDGTWWKE